MIEIEYITKRNRKKANIALLRHAMEQAFEHDGGDCTFVLYVLLGTSYPTYTYLYYT